MDVVGQVRTDKSAPSHNLDTMRNNQCPVDIQLSVLCLRILVPGKIGRVDIAAHVACQHLLELLSREPKGLGFHLDLIVGLWRPFASGIEVRARIAVAHYTVRVRPARFSVATMFPMRSLAFSTAIVHILAFLTPLARRRTASCARSR